MKPAFESVSIPPMPRPSASFRACGSGGPIARLAAEDGLVCSARTVMFIIGVLHRFILLCSVAQLSVVYTRVNFEVLRHVTPNQCTVEDVAQEVACCALFHDLIPHNTLAAPPPPPPHTSTPQNHIPCDCITMYCRSPKFCSSFSCHHDTF